MSIIEKAVDKLEKKAADAKEHVGGGSVVDALSTLPLADAETKQHIPLEQSEIEPVVTESPAVDISTKETTKANRIDFPIARINSLGMVSPDLPRSQIAEEFRAIKRPLLMNIMGEGATVVESANLILVTSALPGEGKTFSAINLAMSIAMEQDKTVLFVDADVSKATASHFLGIPDDQMGLIDILQNDDVAIGDVLLHTNIPNLRVLPAGHVHDRPTELLASDSMRKVVDELSKRYSDRVIVFDSPPLLQTTEAAVLTSLVGQVVMVVAANQTQ
ncbi:MAG: AAA family ATPase, partial [Gammaproteobacteria bacterium]|nr:AAA family ATPase [Gammaproteobacteria bacterium]